MVEGEKTIAILFQKSGELYPFAPAGLTRAQGSRSRLAEHAQGSLLLDRAGQLREIQRVEVTGAYGTSFGSRLWSRLNSTWSIRVLLSPPLVITLADLKERIVRGVAKAEEHGVFYLEDAGGAARVTTAVRAAASADAICTALELPPVEDALDVL